LEHMQDPTWETCSSYRFHVLDLRPPLEELFRATHKTAIQQAIRRADREQLGYDEGRSEALLSQFYRLLLLTRRRHKLPPQPIQWFRNLVACMGERLKIRVASKDGQTVASILTLHWGDTIFYKYGCSDARFHNLGGMSFLLWKTIQEAKEAGAQKLDFGRTDSDNAGLIVFKDRWGASQSLLTYVRHSARRQPRVNDGYRTRLVRQLFARMPDEMLTAAGRLLYRHIG
jgi:lipid II:glycine glycyltransferase (peptidoglycan interpeptide bridge formation enzyme)